MSNVKRGHDTERKCAQALKKLGYDVVRSAASKSIWDLIAIGEHDIRLIQCKRTLRTVKSAAAPKAVIKEMREATSPESDMIKKELWTWVDRKGWTITAVT